MGSLLGFKTMHSAHEPGRASPSRRAARRAWNTSDSARWGQARPTVRFKGRRQIGSKPVGPRSGNGQPSPTPSSRERKETPCAFQTLRADADENIGGVQLILRLRRLDEGARPLLKPGDARQLSSTLLSALVGGAFVNSNVRVVLEQVAALDQRDILDFAKAGNRIPARMAMIAITTNNSIKVKLTTVERHSCGVCLRWHWLGRSLAPLTAWSAVWTTKLVAQSCTLPYRRIVFCGASPSPSPLGLAGALPIGNRRYSRLKICATILRSICRQSHGLHSNYLN